MGRQHERYKETEEKVLEVYFSEPYAGIDEGKLDIVKKIIIEDVGENKMEQAAFFRQMLLSFEEQEKEMSKQQDILLGEISDIRKADKVRSKSEIEEEGTFEEIIALARKEDVYDCLERQYDKNLLESEKERYPRRLLWALLKASIEQGELLSNAILAKKGWPTCEILETDVRDFGRMIHYYERASVLNETVFRGIAIYLRARRERAVAFAMGQHQRVGRESSANEMPVEVVRGVIGF